VDQEELAGARNGSGELVFSGAGASVVLVRWPDQRGKLAELARRGVPRLLLVSAGGEPPDCTSCLEDWIRLPADDADLDARIASLVEHQRAHDLPKVDEYGVLRRHDAFVILSPTEHAITELLIDNFGAVVPDTALERVVDEKTLARSTLRAHASRLRKRIKPLGLTITCIRNIGYMIHDDGRPGPEPLHLAVSERA